MYTYYVSQTRLITTELAIKYNKSIAKKGNHSKEARHPRTRVNGGRYNCERWALSQEANNDAHKNNEDDAIKTQVIHCLHYSTPNAHMLVDSKKGALLANNGEIVEPQPLISPSFERLSM
ncbi:hypothetical protein Tcan_16857 [Toxocara canis]|uniref:Uncharacterized protein n=1 Tax=Toxocara canis TaxID=6265 RepID=A0A0B2V7I5_TOXCA|nr:hypothetical protein Tcan_16857 [Toxocara canis]